MRRSAPMRACAKHTWARRRVDDDTSGVQGLNAWYGESHILHGVDMRVGEGETITILGRNGVGKTTTLRTITGIVRARKGKLFFAGEDMMQVPLHKTARRGIGFVPEERGIFSTLTVSENLLLPPIVASGGLTRGRDLRAVSKPLRAPQQRGDETVGR